MTFERFLARRVLYIFVGILTSLILTALAAFFWEVILGNEMNFTSVWKWVYIFGFVTSFLADFIEAIKYAERGY